MATVTISLTGSSVVNGTKTYTISDPDVQQIIDCMIAKWSPPPPANPLNPTQALLAWVQNQLINPTIQEVQNFGIAKQHATITQPPIVFT